MKLVRGGLALALVLSAMAFGQTPVGLMPAPKAQFFDSNGYPLAGGLIYTCTAGSTCPGNPLATYTDATGTTANQNPIVLDAGGFANIWLAGSSSYKIVVKNAGGTIISTTDGVQNLGLTITALKCAANGLACLDASSHVLQSELNYNQAGTGAVDRSVQNKLQEYISPLDFSGTDFCARVNAAITAAGISGTTIHLPAGQFSCATGINANNTRNITLQGGGGANGGASAATQISYTPATGNIVSANQTAGFWMNDIQFSATNAAWAGTFVDFSHGAFSFDSALGGIKRCGFFGFNGAVAQYIVNLNDSIIIDLEDNAFANADVAILGTTVTGTYSNAITIRHNHFSSSTGSIRSAMIRNVGQGWTIDNNTFEMGGGLGTPAVIDFTAGSPIPQGVSMTSSWIGDGAVGQTQTLITISGNAWNLAGNFIAGRDNHSTGIEILTGSHGVTLKGNAVLFHALGLLIDSGVGAVDYAGNVWGNTVAVSGTPTTGIGEDVSGNLTFFGTTSGTFVGGIAGQLKMTTANGLPSTVGLDGQYLLGGFASPDDSRLYLGNGTGFQLGLYKRNAGTDTKVGYIEDDGKINLTGGYLANGTAGGTQVVNVRNSTNGAACTITYSMGLFLSTTCP